MRKTFRTVLCLAITLPASSLDAQSPSDDTLRMVLEPGEMLAARVFLDPAGAGVQGVSFKVCHSSEDVRLEGTEEGAGILTAKGGAPADFIAVRSGTAGDSGFVTMSAVLDLDGLQQFGPESQELLVLTYDLQPDGTGDSILYCETGDPAVRTLVTREGQHLVPRTRIHAHSVEAQSGAPAFPLGPAAVPIFLTTDRRGLTGGTFVLCHDPAALAIQRVTPTPELAPYSPVVFNPTADGGGFRFSFTLGKPLDQKVEDFPALLVHYDVALSSSGETSEVTFCQGDDSETVLVFGDQTYLPETTGGSVEVVPDLTPQTFFIPHVEVSPDTDPVPVTVEADLYVEEGAGIQSFEVVFSFDSELLEVVDEAAVEDYRGADLAAFLDGKTPVLETRRDEEGYFIYQVDFGPDQLLTREDFNSFPSFTLAKLRLAQKGAPLPEGGTAKLGNGRLPLRFRSFWAADTETLIANRYTTVLGGEVETVNPALDHGSLIFGTAGIRFKASSATVEFYQTPEITISMDTAVGGIVALSYSLSPSTRSVSEAPALLALEPLSSTFTFPERRNYFTHTVIFDPERPLGPVNNFELARLEYAAGTPRTLRFDPAGAPQASLAVSSGGELEAALPVANLEGEIDLLEDINLLAYRVTDGRGPPDSDVEVSMIIDAGYSGIPGFQGAICHDPTSVSISDVSMGADLIDLDAGFVSFDPREEPGEQAAVVFAVIVELDEPFRGLPAGLDQEMFRLTYHVTGPYGRTTQLRFCDYCCPRVANLVVDIQGADPVPRHVQNLEHGEILIADVEPVPDVLAPAIAPEALRRDLQAVAVTEFGWRWGAKAGAAEITRYGPDTRPLGPAISLPATPRRVASGGDGWAWVSLPGEVAILSSEELSRRVAVGGEPYGIAVDRSRSAWVAVSGAQGQLVKISGDGRILRRVLLGPGDQPRELAIDREGAIWVTYDRLGFVSRVAPDGTLLEQSAAQLRSYHAAGVTTDGRGTVWLSDAGDRSLLAFDLEGREVRRLPLAKEPTDISVDGAGVLWTVLKDPDGLDQLVRIEVGPESHELVPVRASSAYHGDRTGLLSLRFLRAADDNDVDGIPNLIEIRNFTNPLDVGDPAGENAVPPVEDLAAQALSVRLTPAAGDGGGGQETTRNTAGVSWTNATSYTKHAVFVDEEVIAPDVSGGATGIELIDLPPGPSTVSVESFVDADVSPAVTTTVQFGPGTAVRTAELDVEPADLAVAAASGTFFVLDGQESQVLVLDSNLRELDRVSIPAPLGGGVLTGIAFREEGDDGAGSLVVLAGMSGEYQEISLEGDSLGGPWEVPFGDEDTFFAHLTSGRLGGEPHLFSVARGPQNDDIIAFRVGREAPPAAISDPLGGAGAALGGIAFHPGGGPATERLWIARGLPGEALARLVLEVSLDGGPSLGTVLLSVFDQPGGTPEVRGIGLTPLKSDLYVVTSDRRLHVLSDFGIARGAEQAPGIVDVRAGTGEVASGPVAGGAEVVIEGHSFGSDPDDLRALFGNAPADNVSLEQRAGMDRLTVLAPPATGPGPVPIFLFRTRAFDFVETGFFYCDAPGAGPDCDGDGIPDACQLTASDCNGNGIPDACDLAQGTSLDDDGDGLPDECGRQKPFLRGDANGDGRADMSDAIYVLGHLFLGNPRTLGCRKSGDCNDDGVVDLSDGIHLLSYLFLGSPPPPPPFGECGYDATVDPLTCASYAPCPSS